MRIAICYEHFDPSRGGLEVYARDLVRHLAQHGHRVDLIGHSCHAAYLESPSVFFHEVPQRGLGRRQQMLAFAQSCEALAAVLPCDVAVSLSRACSLDVWILQGGTYAGSWRLGLHKHRSPILRWLADWAKALSPRSRALALREHDLLGREKTPFLVVPSRMVRDHLVTYYGIPERSVWVIPNAVDGERLRIVGTSRVRRVERARWGLAEHAPVGLFLATNYRLKGLAPLLRAVQRVQTPAFRLLVCGSDRDGRWRRLAARLHVSDRVLFAGYATDARTVFAMADFLIHPTFYDPCSLVVLEALAYGLPVITTRANGAAELLHPPADGIILDDPWDTDLLARYIDYWCDPLRRAGATRHAHRAAARWTWHDHFQALLAVLHRASYKRLAA
ncbi:MAG: glycosyltransferase family 1 protein [Gemmataceae bacterium]